MKSSEQALTRERDRFTAADTERQALQKTLLEHAQLVQRLQRDVVSASKQVELARAAEAEARAQLAALSVPALATTVSSAAGLATPRSDASVCTDDGRHSSAAGSTSLDSGGGYGDGGGPRHTRRSRGDVGVSGSSHGTGTSRGDGSGGGGGLVDSASVAVLLEARNEARDLFDKLRAAHERESDLRTKLAVANDAVARLTTQLGVQHAHTDNSCLSLDAQVVCPVRED